MENTQPLPSQNFTETATKRQSGIGDSRLFVIVVISVLLTAMITGSAVYFWQKSVNKKAISNLEQKISSLEKQVSIVEKTKPGPQAVPSSSLTPLPATNLTASWKTCTNLKLGFRIKYPADFEFNPDSCEYAIMNYDFVKNINVVTPLDDFRKNWLLTITVEESNLTPNQWITNNNLCPQNLCSKRIPGPIANSIELDTNAHYSSVAVITKVKGRIFNFSLGARNPNVPVTPEIRDIYYQILSTLKFTD